MPVQSAPLLLTLTHRRLTAGRTAPATLWARMATHAAPTSADAWFMLGRSYKRARRWHAAQHASVCATQLAPHHWWAWCDLGVAATARHDHTAVHDAWCALTRLVYPPDSSQARLCHTGPDRVAALAWDAVMLGTIPETGWLRPGHIRVRLTRDGVSETLVAARCDPARAVVTREPSPRTGSRTNETLLLNSEYWQLITEDGEPVLLLEAIGVLEETSTLGAHR